MSLSKCALQPPHKRTRLAQGLIFWLAGELLVHAHCYLHRPNLVPFGHRLPYAPHYFLKLKSTEALIQVMLSCIQSC